MPFPYSIHGSFSFQNHEEYAAALVAAQRAIRTTRPTTVEISDATIRFENSPLRMHSTLNPTSGVSSGIVFLSREGCGTIRVTYKLRLWWLSVWGPMFVLIFLVASARTIPLSCIATAALAASVLLAYIALGYISVLLRFPRFLMRSMGV